MSNRMSLVEGISHLAVWTIGLCAAIYLVQKFEPELKPLVLAFIVVSILEGVVQNFEWLFQKGWILIRLLSWKSWQLFGFLFLQFLSCCFGSTCNIREPELKEFLRDICVNWGDLGRRWTGGDAGRSSIFRILAVLLTLGLVGLLMLVLKGLVQNEVSAVTDKFGLFKSQVSSIVSFGDHFLTEAMPRLPLLVPEPYKNHTAALLESTKQRMDEFVSELPSTLESRAVSLLNQIVAQTSSSLMDLVFFMLYCAFLLFNPLHINFDDPSEQACTMAADVSRRRRLADGWVIRMGCKVSRQIWQQSRRSTAGVPLLEEPTSVPEAAAEEGRVRRAVTVSPPVLSRRASTRSLEDEEEASRAREDDDNGGTRFPAQFRLTEVQYYIYRIVWNYFLLTMFLNAILATLVFFLLQYLNIDLAVVLAAGTFMLSFIPELGAIIAMCLPVPFILLTPTSECRVQRHLQEHGKAYFDGVDETCISDFVLRLKSVLFCVVGTLAIKLLVSNCLSACLMGRNRILAGAVGDNDNEVVRETHGVLVLFAVVFFGKVWGVVGMLISVPVISVLRLTINMGLEKTSPKTLELVSSMRQSSGLF